jgi:dienelactone hydrolase
MPQSELRPQPRVSYVTFPSASQERPLTIAGQLRVPIRDGNVPAVVIVHGTNGVDSRGSYHAEALNDAGIATLEIDMWSPRGLSGGAGPNGRPQGVPETLPDAYGALLFLASRSGIDPQRIGITGFSWGGVVSMLTATRPYSDLYMGANPLRFAAHAPFYPICWGYNKIPGYEFAELTGAPVFIQSGQCDAYDEPDSCTQLISSLPEQTQRDVTVTMYPEAMHGFNRLEPAQVVNDPFSHLGRGGEVRFEANLDAAGKSRQATVEFFERAFAAVGQVND